jgi:hypothetical protein
VTQPTVGDHWRVDLSGIVPEGRILQIDMINCVWGTSALPREALLLTRRNVTSATLQERLIGLLENTATGDSLLGNGPFYFLAGEAPTLFLYGTPEDQLICTMTGIFWTTN